MKWLDEQACLYELLRKDGNCFLHMCHTQDAMWVSDLSKRACDLTELSNRLEENGFVYWIDNANGLLKIDPSEKKLNNWIVLLPDKLPSFPENDRYHSLYALCRFWYYHSDEAVYMPMLRKLIKLSVGSEDVFLKSASKLHEEAVTLDKSGIRVGSAAWRLLDQWLSERENAQ